MSRIELLRCRFCLYVWYHYYNYYYYLFRSRSPSNASPSSARESYSMSPRKVTLKCSEQQIPRMLELLIYSFYLLAGQEAPRSTKFSQVNISCCKPSYITALYTDDFDRVHSSRVSFARHLHKASNFNTTTDQAEVAEVKRTTRL